MNGGNNGAGDFSGNTAPPGSAQYFVEGYGQDPYVQQFLQQQSRPQSYASPAEQYAMAAAFQQRFIFTSGDPSMMRGDPSMMRGDPSMMRGDPSMMRADPSMMRGDPSMMGTGTYPPAYAAFQQLPPAQRYPPQQLQPLGSRPSPSQTSAQPTQRTLTSVWQRSAPENNMGVPEDHFLVSYESLRTHELQLAASVDSTGSAANEEAPQGVPEMEEPWSGSRCFSFNVSCDVCMEWKLLRDVSNLSPAKMYDAGRKPLQSHQCVGCGIVVHRLCYGITGCLLKEPLFLKAAPPGQAKIFGRKAIPAPKVPLLSPIWERNVAPAGKSPYCRFICDACLYLSQLAVSFPGPDVLHNLPLGGRCLLCANSRGPRKLVTVEKTEHSALPDFVFAHAFCILTASRGICRIRDWKTLSGISIDENALFLRRHQFAPHLKSPFCCEICHEGGALQTSIGLGLEVCRFFGNGGENDRCWQLYHPLCLRNMAGDFEQRNGHYRHAFESVLAPRAQLDGTRSLAFGICTCFNHAFQPEDSTAGKRVCALCQESTVDPVYPNSWTRCRHCFADLHTNCTEQAGAPFRAAADLCRPCIATSEALSMLQAEWETASLMETRGAFHGSDCHLQLSLPISLPARIMIARERLSNERFSKAFASSLEPHSNDKGAKSLLADALVAVMASKFFSPELTQAMWRVPVQCSLQSYILLKSIYSKRYAGEDGKKQAFFAIQISVTSTAGRRLCKQLATGDPLHGRPSHRSLRGCVFNVKSALTSFTISGSTNGY
eukprot:Gregarina_sp_Poly_1__1405@NODE_134_length_13191_cov_35_340369_g82_i1_p2_GENE_NODE_134_length_13191_cov_35_340369_g82_i1NODE_134_length_13191_cov_35_340369_g82_i1_p2_ORF_typecomplete_len773_score86_80PHD_4/PF16866_5/68PHD_4/PF16866_5/5_4e03PHD_4/PF16866_5/6_6PHD_4/PF16866_5/0_74C1_1/PF00130_22/1_9C1_1/PF00130_22/4_2e02C1_1/PF00130_22/0_36_NODE_134_length_13191_cov_35_340369_g82_i11422460